MFEPASRYAKIETATLERPDGRTVAYVRRRFLPRGATLPLLAEVTVNQGDRLDVVTAATLGDPEQFWRICDANDAMHPDDLTPVPGRRLRIAAPQG